ncbi:hypothetical protein [Actinomadura alba]|uniref:Secreted protein n=1 Tax=Actinomadura alba TaxID=406431 RepID=A0ABR7M2G3_9ACTN|nr:hypothetical protein [Actinomadura alba]MBC6471304.1 hypothetical protein [Actinomadura alba]
MSTRTHTDHDGATHDTGHAGMAPRGLDVSQHGYTLAAETAILRPGETDFRFQILGPDGRAVTAVTPIHDRKLHLIVVREDLTGFWHVHPVEEGDGIWSARLALPEAGAYRAFADIAPEALGDALTLGADLAVTGVDEPRPVPEPATSFSVDDYEVGIEGELVAGQARRVTLTVSKDGSPVTDLQPYLAAYGHLVVLRVGDLAYVHVHPDGSPGDGVTEAGPGITFHAQVPGPGTYRLFLDFKHGDVVRTAAFTAITR